MINNRPPSASSTSIYVTITLTADTLYSLISSSNSAFNKKHFCQHWRKISSNVFYLWKHFLFNNESRNVNFMKIKSWRPINWNFFHPDIDFLFLCQVGRWTRTSLWRKTYWLFNFLFDRMRRWGSMIKFLTHLRKT